MYDIYFKKDAVKKLRGSLLFLVNKRVFKTKRTCNISPNHNQSHFILIIN